MPKPAKETAPPEILEADRALKAFRKQHGAEALNDERNRLHDVFTATARRMHLRSTHRRVAAAVARAERKANSGILMLVYAERISCEAAFEAHRAHLAKLDQAEAHLVKLRQAA